MAKILIVDDLEENLLLLKTYLESDGYNVIIVQNGVEALGKLKSEKVDLIISDILMPQMDGFTLCRTVKQDNELKKIPFIFYTATYTDEQDEKLALSLGASKFILKPKEKDEFNRLIKEVINQFDSNTLSIEKIEEENQLNYYKLYNEVLIRKLESKMLQLEKAEKEARLNLLFLNQIIEAMPNPLVIIDENFNIIKANKIFIKTYFGNENMVNKDQLKLDKIFFEDSELKVLLEELIKEDFEIKNYQFEFIKDDNKDKKIFNLNAFKIDSSINSGKNIVIIMEDITFINDLINEKNIVENQLIQSQKLEALGRFAGGIAHDFNNLLTVIINCGQNIYESLESSDPLYEDAKNIYDAANRGATLTKKLLSFSRKSKGEPQVIDINNSILEINTLAKRLVGEDINVEYNLNAKQTKVLMEQIDFEQIMINLFSNAKDAMMGGGKINITTENIEVGLNDKKNILPGKYIKIEFSDTGSGIEKTTLEKIFNPFFTTKKEGAGTGLGLYLVSSIIERANGYIYAYSELGHGTTFIILLPITFEVEENILSESTNIIAVKKINNALIVEDDQFVMLAIEKMMSKLNIFTKKANCAKEAIRIIDEEKYRPEFVMVDIILEDISGENLVKILKRKIENFKVLYMSGYSIDEIKNKGINILEINFIQKPFNVKELNDKIVNLFS